MADRILFDEDGAKRIVNAVRYVEGQEDARYRTSRAVVRAPEMQPVRVTDTTPVDGRYPGKVLRHDAATDTYADLADVWIIALDGSSLSAMRYLARRSGDANGRPVFVVNAQVEVTIDADTIAAIPYLKPMTIGSCAEAVYGSISIEGGFVEVTTCGASARYASIGATNGGGGAASCSCVDFNNISGYGSGLAYESGTLIVSNLYSMIGSIGILSSGIIIDGTGLDITTNYYGSNWVSFRVKHNGFPDASNQSFEFDARFNASHHKPTLKINNGAGLQTCADGTFDLLNGKQVTVVSGLITSLSGSASNKWAANTALLGPVSGLAAVPTVRLIELEDLTNLGANDNQFIAGSTGSAPIVRALVNADMPAPIDIAHGGTNSSTALNDNCVMVSSGGKVVEAGPITDGQILIGNTGSLPTAGMPTDTLTIKWTGGPGWLKADAKATADDNVTAAGTTPGTATLLAALWNVVRTATAGVNDGVILDDWPIGTLITVFNQSGAVIKIYPNSGAQLGTLGTNNPFSTAGGVVRWARVSSTQWLVS